MDPHKRHLKKLKRLQDLRKQKLKEKEKVKKKKSKKNKPTTEINEEGKNEVDVSVERIEEQSESDKTGNELSLEFLGNGR